MRKIRLAGILMSLLSLTAFAKDCTATDKHCSQESGLYTIGSTVTTSPVLGIRSAYDAHDVIVNLSTMNEDLRILKQRLELKERFGTAGVPCARRPLLEISGDLIGTMYYAETYFDGPIQGMHVPSSRHDINLSGARIDFLAEVSPWAFGYISLDYDDTKLSDAIQGAGQRIANSRIFLKRGFITMGDLDEYPVYFSIGQMYVPFGRYSTYTVTTPVTRALGRTNARAALLGMSYDGIYAQAYGFKGDSDVASTGINQWGLNAGYEFYYNDINVELGAGVIGNMADSIYFQDTGAPFGFKGFGENSDTEVLDHRVPAYNLHGKLSWMCFVLNAEYVSALRHFDQNDLSFNNHGAMPSAFHIEGDFRYQYKGHSMAFALAYGHTTEALGVNIPKDSFTAAFSAAIVKNSIASIEYRHDKNYSDSNSSGSLASGVVPSVGGSRNAIVGQVGIYF